MNFYAHCHLARLDGADAAFALGSMLPDFAGMSGARLVRVDHPEVALGVTHHHVVDGIFHAAPTFVRLCQESSVRLDAAGSLGHRPRGRVWSHRSRAAPGRIPPRRRTGRRALPARSTRAKTRRSTCTGALRVEADTRFRRLCRRLHELGANPDHGSPGGRPIGCIGRSRPVPAWRSKTG
ncbi:MAG: hypothetical protein R3B99_30390 [Polyangiales bacterium]